MTDRLGTGNNASQMNRHIEDFSNPHLTSASQVGADPLGSASAVQLNLDSHIDNLSNPHLTTASQIGADPLGSASAVQIDLNAHLDDYSNPHLTTASQVGADPVGSASAVQLNLNSHTGDHNNPHSTTASQVGADVLGSASIVQGNLNSHTGDHNNPHLTTASQIGALVANSPIIPATHTKIQYDLNGFVISGSDATTADISDSLNRRYVTDANLVTISNTSGCNTGDQVVPVLTTSASNFYLTGYNNVTGSFTSASVVSTASYVFTASGVYPITVTGSIISLETSGVISGSYNAVYVDSFGRVISGSNITVSSGSIYTGSSVIDVSGSIISHLGSGVVSGSYNAVYVNSFGHVVSGSNIAIDHTTNVLNVGTNTHSQIDSALNRLVNTSGSNTGDVIVTSSSTIAFSITGQNISASVIQGAINHNSLSGLAIDDPHPQYVSVSGDTMSGSLVMGNNSISQINTIQYNTSYSKGGEPVGSVYWNSSRETLDVVMPNGVILQEGQELHFFAANHTGADIPDGSVVMFDGALGASGVLKCKLAIADGTYPATYIMGIATQTIYSGGTGKVTFFGEVADYNTSGYPAGTILYVDPAIHGGLTDVEPLAPNLKYQIASTVDSKNNGHIFVRAIYSMALHELNDVNISASPLSGQFLVYNASGSYWYNRDGYSGSNVISISGSVISHSNSGITSGSYNSVLVDSMGHVVSGSVVLVDHLTNVLNVGTNTHSQIDSALNRLVNTTGSNTGDQIVPVQTNKVDNYYFTGYNSSTGSFTSASVISSSTGSFSASGVYPIVVTNGSVISHATSGIVSGSYNAVYVDSNGHVVSGSNVSTGTAYTGSGIISVSGSVISHGNTGVVSGSYNAVSVDANGHVVSGSNVAIDHTVNVLNVGVNTHSQIDSALSRLINTTGSNTGDVTVTSSSTISMAISGQKISASIIETAINHNSLLNLTTGNPHTQYLTSACFVAQNNLVKDPTGFLYPEDIVSTYSGSSTRTITLTGSVVAYYNGQLVPELVPGWTSGSHGTANGVYYLYYDSGSFVWSNTLWTFDKLQIAYVYYGTSDKFAGREVHGLMPWLAHEEFHETIGTYKESGGDLSGYTLASTTATNRRPNVSLAKLHDEDCVTNNAALTSGSYTKYYLSGSPAANTFVVETAEIVPLLANNPYYNSFTGGTWGQTLMANSSYMSVWLIAMPMASDTISQKYRYIWIQGQSNGNLASQQALLPSDLNTSYLSNISTEFVFLAKLILNYAGGNWSITSVTNYTGNRASQVGSPAGNFLSSVSTDSTLTGVGTVLSPLSVYGLSVSASKTLYVLNSASISGSNSGDQIVPQNTTSTSNQFFIAYNNTTGSFTTGSALTAITGSAPISVSGSTISHATSGIVSGSYNAVQVDTFGHVISGSNINYTYTGSNVITVTGSVISHNTSGITTGSYNAVYVDSRGHVVSGSNVSYAYSGSSPVSVSGSVISLTTSGVTSGSYNAVYVDGWGRVISGSNISTGTTYTGSAPITVTGSVISHNTSGIVSGSYTKVIVDDKGHVTGGTTTHYEILQDDAGAILTDSLGIDILYVEVA